MALTKHQRFAEAVDRCEPNLVAFIEGELTNIDKEQARAQVGQVAGRNQLLVYKPLAQCPRLPGQVTAQHSARSHLSRSAP